MPTTVTIADGSGQAKHEIDFKGLAGIIFWLLLAGTILYVIAFFTEGWVEVGNTNIGLWKACVCSSDHSYEAQCKYSLVESHVNVLAI